MGDFDPSIQVTASEPLPRRIGVLGGTFDPVHIGHLRGALEVAESLALDELRLTPSARPPHRGTPQVSAKDRLAMVKCAVAGVPPLVVDARELQRDKPSYTIDTLELMRAELAAPDQVFFLLLGWDAFLRPAHLAPLGRVAPALPHPGAATPGCRQRTAGCLAQPAGSALGERPAGPQRAERTDCIRLADAARGIRHPDPSTAGQR